MNEGFQLPREVNDTITLAHLIYSDRLLGLKKLARLIDPSYHNFDIALKEHYARTGLNFITIPYDDPYFYSYAGIDACMTAQLYRLFTDEISSKLYTLYKLEMRSQRALFDMERVGIKVDLRYLNYLNEQYLDYMRQIKEWAIQAYNTDLTSRNDVISGLMDVGWQPTVRTEKGNISIAAEVLKQFPHPLAETYSKFKRIQKYNSTYVENVRSCVTESGIVHCSIKPVGAITGRMSIANPPLQQLPRSATVRNIFKAHRGMKFVSIDYDQMELRLLAHYTEDELLLKSFESSDPHTETAKAIYRVDEITKEQRQITKNATYCIVYGGGADKLAYTAKIELEYAQDFMKAYLDAFPKVRDYGQTLINGSVYDEDKDRHCIETMYGRLQWTDSEHLYRFRNYIIQGTAADVLKESIAHMHNDESLSLAMRLPIHDEVVFEIDEEDAKELLESAKEYMTAEQFNPTLTVSGNIMDRLGEKF